MLKLTQNADGTVDCRCLLGIWIATFANMDRAVEYLELLDMRILTEPDSPIRGGASTTGEAGKPDPVTVVPGE